MNKFDKQGYVIVKGLVEKELATFLYNYSLMKKNTLNVLLKTKYISPFEKIHGIYNDIQVPNTFSIYGDVAMETLLLRYHGEMEKHTGLTLYPNYAYMRVYKYGDVLERHKDRYSCEISTTISLGGDMWPIYLKPSNKQKEIKVMLGPGDLLIYKGSVQEHWREPFNGEVCAQVFLHYTDASKPEALENIYDRRECLGLPAYLKK